jgi:glutamine synthetase
LRCRRRWYQKQVAQSVTAVKQAGGTSAEGKKLLGKITKLTDGLKQQTDKLQGALAHESSDAVKHAKHFRDAVIPAMTKLRGTADELETIIPQTSGRSRRIARCCFK